MNYRDNITQFTLESRVKIRAALDSSQAVAVRQFCEDADIAVVFELDTFFFLFFFFDLVKQFRSDVLEDTDGWPFF